MKLTRCPWAARTWLALEAVRAPYEAKHIDLANKPDWFFKVSSTGKVPTLAVGNTVLVESSITTRYVAQAFPDGKLISADPLANARSELWAEMYINKVALPFFYRLKDQDPKQVPELFFQSLDSVLPLLSKPGPYAINQNHPLLGDVLVAPFIARIQLLLDKGVLSSSIAGKLSGDPRYADYTLYSKHILEWPAFKKIHNPEAIFQNYLTKFAPTKL